MDELAKRWWYALPVYKPHRTPAHQYQRLSIASTALRFSAIKLERQSQVLSAWLAPVANLIQRQTDPSDQSVQVTIHS